MLLYSMVDNGVKAYLKVEGSTNVAIFFSGALQNKLLVSS